MDKKQILSEVRSLRLKYHFFLWNFVKIIYSSNRTGTTHVHLMPRSKVDLYLHFSIRLDGMLLIRHRENVVFTSLK
jgi:hypothetical protein